MSDAFDLTGKTALITGAGVGIGKAIAEALGQAGAFVGVHYRSSAEHAEQTLVNIREVGGDGVLLQGDLTIEADAHRIVDQLVEKAGRLDILVNNAGSPIQRAKIEELSLDLWNQIIQTNLTSAFMVTRRAIPHLRATKAGAIVNNLSLSVQTGGANGAGAYAAAKGGLQVLTRTLARELAPDVRTNAIMPGVIETRHHELFSTPERMEQYREQTPMQRNGEPVDVASAVLYLVSESASFINGALLDICGGRFLR